MCLKAVCAGSLFFSVFCILPCSSVFSSEDYDTEQYETRIAGGQTAISKEISVCSGKVYSDAGIRLLAEDFVNGLVEKKFLQAYRMFSSEMKKKLGMKELEKLWKDLIANLGAYRRFEKSDIIHSDRYGIVHLTTEFERGKVDFRIVFDDDFKITGFFVVPPEVGYHIPSYVRENSFEEREIKIGGGEWELPGTLTLPSPRSNREGPEAEGGRHFFPCLILVHGSGPADRDESVGGVKVFRDIASGLASRGIATIRYEKRTRHYAEKIASNIDRITVREEVIDDVVEAVKVARSLPEIDSREIFILGHSLGGMLIPLIARAMDEQFGNSEEAVAGYIIAAGNASPLQDLVVRQVSYLAALDGEITVLETLGIALEKFKAENVRKLSPSNRINRTFLTLSLPASYWLSLKGYEPAKEARNIRVPLLLIQGERDYQVTVDELGLYREELQGKANVTVKSYPRLNHLFVEGDGLSSPAEYMREGHVSQEVIEDLAFWIKGNIAEK